MVTSKHGDSKSRSCLKYLVAFCDRATALVDEGRDTDTTYLKFCKAFDTVTSTTSLYPNCSGMDLTAGALSG